jgi:dihydroxy-acid dehydratase
MLTGGPSEPPFFRGRQLGAGTDLWHYADELRAGRMSQEEFAELEAAATPTYGTCNEMGTASTMAALVETMGMSLPGSATVPAVGAARLRIAEATGARAVELAHAGGPAPHELLTKEAFDDAVTVLAAVGGGTNAVVHLLALAGRVGVPLTLDSIHEISRRTPLVANVRPSGEHLVEQLHLAGGVQALLTELAPLLHQQVAGVQTTDRTVIATLDEPFGGTGAISVVRGSLAPNGAIMKRSAASPQLLRHRGPALVFEDVYDVQSRIDDPDLPVTADTVLVLRNSGPKGGPGMPEWGQIPIPAKLLAAGVTDMVRISDARMSGTAFGTVVLHVSPESAAGGPLRAVRDGDPIELDVDAQRIDLALPQEEIDRRLAELGPPEPRYRRGYGKLYVEHVLQAHEGCDFDFLRAREGEPPDTEPYGLLSGWVGGW